MASRVRSLARNLKPDLLAAKSLLTLESRLSRDLRDPALFPEVAREAVVRRGGGLCAEEERFLEARRRRVRDGFARYMGWDPAQVHPEDVPTVAFGGSGGGYRAMLAVLGYVKGMKESGLWDLVSYVAGVSGSCKSGGGTRCWLAL